MPKKHKIKNLLTNNGRGVTLEVYINERNAIMSKIKSSLPEDIDVTDSREPVYGATSKQPSEADWAITDLIRSTKEVVAYAHDLTLSDVADIAEVIEDLQGLVQSLNKPF